MTNTFAHENVLLVAGGRTYRLSGVKIEITPRLEPVELSTLFAGTDAIGELRELEASGRCVSVAGTIEEERETPRKWAW